ncbi:uncharacterized protein PFL1_03206 [Pseudozyma flocculosa PF-1]|uniref:Uncharacterized protein n=1 Tax=Pseudozyma flocculosa PF-1 TaxID=1277687 RepID=A0A061HFQ8_9BASI|nr:uncharacterized protein PFL1_03206 [Pseudozyma flocculosa PF-1]EPQ29451.1 hypothetical protein PFL1_03206 [Pseudozyma flocculosa PF-1]
MSLPLSSPRTPKRRPTTRRLLSVANVRTACKVLYLDDQIKTLEARWKEVEAREDELLEREEALAAAQRQGLASPLQRDLQSRMADYEARLAELEERELHVRQAEEVVSRKERSVDAQRQMCSDEWDKWYAGEKGKALEDNQALASRVAKLEAQLRRMAASDGHEGASMATATAAAPSLRRQARHSELPMGRKAAALPRADSLTGNLSSVGTRPPVAASAARNPARPTARRTASGGKARLSLDGDVSMLSIRERLAAGATGLGTPRTAHQQVVVVQEPERESLQADDQEQGQSRSQGRSYETAAASSPRQRTSSRARVNSQSQGSDEWIDQEGRDDKWQSPTKAPSSSAAAATAPATSLEPSSAAHQQRQSRARASRRQTIATELVDEDAAADADRQGQGSIDAGIDDGLDRHHGPLRPRASRPRLSRREASDAAEAELHAAREEQRMLDAIAARSTASASASASAAAALPTQRSATTAAPSSSASSSSSSTSTSTSSAPAHASPRRRATVATTLTLPEDPNWMQYDEEDRPSPFIKRISRLPEKVLTRPTTGTGAAGAAHQPAKLSLLMKATRAAAVQAAGEGAAAAAAAAAEGDGIAATSAAMIPSLPSASSIIEEDASMTSLSRIEAPPVAVRPAPAPPSPATAARAARTAASGQALPPARPAAISSNVATSSASATDKENVRTAPRPTSNALQPSAATRTRRLSHVVSSSSIPSMMAATTASNPLASDLVNQHQSTTLQSAGGGPLKPTEARRTAHTHTLASGPLRHAHAHGTTASQPATAALRRPRSSLLAGITVAPLKPPSGSGSGSGIASTTTTTTAAPSSSSSTTTLHSGPAGSTGSAAAARRISGLSDRPRERERERVRSRLSTVPSS